MRYYVTIDTETTGLDPAVHSLLNLSAVVTNEGGAVLDVYNTFISPPQGAVISPQAMEVNGLDIAKIQSSGAPLPALAMFEFDKYLKDIRGQEIINPTATERGKVVYENEIYLVAHNMLFDGGFIQTNMRQAEIDPWMFRRQLDTYTFGFAVHGKLMSLKALAEAEGVAQLREHRATNDALTTSTVFHSLRKKLGVHLTPTITYIPPTPTITYIPPYIPQPYPYSPWTNIPNTTPVFPQTICSAASDQSHRCS